MKGKYFSLHRDKNYFVSIYFDINNLRSKYLFNKMYILSSFGILS
jgi:hypothetical protein